MITSSYTPCLVSTDPTLTPDNLTRVLEIMGDVAWNHFALYINLPDTERSKIKSQYDSARDRKLALPHVFISAHPAPSWERVAHALYQTYDDSCHTYLQQHFPTGIYIQCVCILVCSTGDSALGVLCCFALFVCLTLLASFFLPSHLSLKTCTHVNVHCMYSVQCTLYTEIASIIHVYMYNASEHELFISLTSFVAQSTYSCVQCILRFNVQVHVYRFCLVLPMQADIAPRRSTSRRCCAASSSWTSTR